MENSEKHITQKEGKIHFHCYFLLRVYTSVNTNYFESMQSRGVAKIYEQKL